uniref:subtilisin n=1 Tax=Thraustotheca clavata TaxID=74557 RepID=A0A0A7CM17_9STRA|nr:secreted protein [Thraustotheca clavata]
MMARRIWFLISMVNAMNVLVHLHEPLEEMIEGGTRQEVYEFLAARYAPMQMKLWDMAVASNASIVPLWIQNTLIVYNATTSLIEGFSAMEDVLAVEQDQIVYLDETMDTFDVANYDESIQTNVKLLHADEAWSKGFNGKGVTIASIDSGVRYSHEILSRAYRGYVDGKSWKHDYAYWITKSQNQTLTPDNADEVGHGTHTLGTAVGAQGVGVAPGATWIAARPFNSDGSATQSDILLAAQWVMCPTTWEGTQPDCSRGADIVSNSFGGNSSIEWMDKIVQTWSKANILPVFASGNVNGFECGSVLCPGCIAEAIAVGALIGGTTLWGGSGKGPGKDGVIKPDFVAPGVAIRSAASYDDKKFTRMTGTSMATPHVSGAAAIVLQKYTTSITYMNIALGVV